MATTSGVKPGADDEARFNAAFLEHHQGVYRYCVRRLGPSDAEDAAAEVFAVAWRRIDRLPEGDVARAWLIGVAYKVVGNRFRSRRRQARLAERIAVLDPAQETVPTPDWNDVTERLRTALYQLSPTDRELLQLSAWDELSRREIALVLGVTENAVDQRLHRARARLQSRLDRITSRVRPVDAEEAPA